MIVKSGVVAAATLAVALLVPAGAKQAEAMPLAKPAVKEMALKHKVGRWGRRGFRGFRGRGFRGFRGRRFGGIRLGFRRGFRGRRFYRGFRGRRFFRPRARYYYGGPRYYSRRGCYHLKRRYKYTGNLYWWDRYKACKFGYYY